MSRAERGSALALVSVAVAVVSVAVAARVDVAIPGTPVPQSLQTLAVVLVGGALGLRLGTLALVAYLSAGAVGLPVFAGGAAGMDALVGPTAGYLGGFVGAAALVGWAGDRGRLARFGPALAAAVAAHLVILLPGWAWLARDIGAGAAWRGGVTPFLWGGAVKAAVAAALLAWTPLGSAARVRAGARSVPPASRSRSP